MILRLYLENLKRVSLGQVFQRIRKRARKCIPVRLRRSLCVRQVIGQPPVPGAWFIQPNHSWVAVGSHSPLLERMNPPRLCGTELSIIAHSTKQVDAFVQFAYHSFDFLVEVLDQILLSGEQDDIDFLTGELDRWMDLFGEGDDIGWEAHPTAKRVCNWLRILDSLPVQIPVGLRNRMAISLQEQLALLFRDIEYDLGGNHLITEAKALLMGGLYFGAHPSASRWVRTGQAVLESALPKQVLSDGGHYERSPMYQIVVLWDCLEAFGLSVRKGINWASTYQAALRRMLRFTLECVWPDGTVPNLNDSFSNYVPVARGEVLLIGHILLRTDYDLADSVLTPKVSWVTGMTEWSLGGRSVVVRPDTQLLSWKATGYVGYRSADDMILLDCGPVGPQENPGHGHADPLQVLWHAGGLPVLIDPGVNTYHDLKWRNHFRGTAAHNCAVIDGENAAELWGKFRFGKLYEACCDNVGVVFTGGVPAFHFRGSHNGYKRLRDPAQVEREAWFLPGMALVVLDTIRAPREHVATVHYHFHPGVQIGTAPERDALQFFVDGREFRALASASAPISHETLYGHANGGWFAPRYNTLVPASTWKITVRFRETVTIQATFLYPGVDTNHLALQQLLAQLSA
ncbi:MAG TPA: alginate lyase family protein [Symbiobacteriaceae bacterium]|nr:alginate lyase family protein [Symbiobacteriaceae bacterium]